MNHVKCFMSYRHGSIRSNEIVGTTLAIFSFYNVSLLLHSLAILFTCLAYMDWNLLQNLSIFSRLKFTSTREREKGGKAILCLYLREFFVLTESRAPHIRWRFKFLQSFTGKATYNMLVLCMWRREMKWQLNLDDSVWCIHLDYCEVSVDYLFFVYRILFQDEWLSNTFDGFCPFKSVNFKSFKHTLHTFFKLFVETCIETLKTLRCLISPGVLIRLSGIFVLSTEMC